MGDNVYSVSHATRVTVLWRGEIKIFFVPAGNALALPDDAEVIATEPAIYQEEN